MNTLNDLETKLTELADHMKASKMGTLHLYDGARPVEDGYIELAVNKDPEYVTSWNTMFSDPARVGWHRVTAERMKELLCEKVAAVDSLIDSASFIEVIGHPSRLFQKGDDLSFVFISDDRLTLIFHSTNWGSLEEFYGQYLRPTRR